MKRIILLLSMTVFVMSCNTEKKPEFALISGEITNPLSDEVMVTNAKGEPVFTAKLAEDRTFKDTVFNADGFYNLKAGNEVTAMYLKNGYDVNISLDTKEFDETIQYTGVGAETNNFQAQKYLLNEKNVGNMRALFGLEESEFLTRVEDNFKSINDLVSSVKDQDFVKLVKDNLKVDRASLLSQYQPYHGIIIKDKDFKVSADFPDPYKGIDLTDANLYENNQAFKFLVHSKFYTEVSEQAKADNKSFIEVGLDKLKGLPSGAIRDGLVGELFYDKSIYNEENSDIANEAIALIGDEDAKKKILDEKALMETVSKGKKSPQFVDYENYNGGTSSLVDFKGKYVYIDVWATWCGPCKAEIPYLKKLEEQYHNKNIEFVSISVDKDKDKAKWKAMIEDKQMKGVQLFANKDWKSDFVVKYGIKGIPTFILIDPNGNIVTAGAPRPSDPKLVELFKSLSI